MVKKMVLTGLVLAVTLVLPACALDPNAGGGVNSGNAARVYIFTPEEQAGMSAEGAIETMVTPSEIRERFKNAGQVTKPTGVVNYCDAGLAQLIQARRNEALAAIDAVCGGKDQYAIRHEGPGNIQARHIGNVQVEASCTRSKAIIFRCNGAQPKPDVRK